MRGILFLMGFFAVVVLRIYLSVFFLGGAWGLLFLGGVLFLQVVVLGWVGWYFVTSENIRINNCLKC